MPTHELRKKLTLSAMTRRLKEDGCDITRSRLRNILDISDELSWEVLEYGVQMKVLKKKEQNYIECIEAFELDEFDYYDYIERSLNVLWTKISKGNGSFVLDRTAHRNSKIVGRWTRPDFTLASYRKFPYIKEQEFDIVTFEVKRPEDVNALAVFEALAHNSAATKSYVVFPVDERTFQLNDQSERIKEECTRHGIGLIITDNIFKEDSARIVIEGQRKALNQEKCSAFLQAVMSPSSLAKVSAW